MSVGKNWAGEQGGALEFKASKPASLILEHVAFLRNIVSKADPAAQYKPVDVVISPSRPTKHIFFMQLGQRLPVLDCWFSHDALFTRPCRDCRGRPCRARCCASICNIATCIGNDCCVFTPQHCSLVAWATSQNISRFGAWTTARSMAITPISCVLCYVCF